MEKVGYREELDDTHNRGAVSVNSLGLITFHTMRAIGSPRMKKFAKDIQTRA